MHTTDLLRAWVSLGGDRPGPMGYWSRHAADDQSPSSCRSMASTWGGLMVRLRRYQFRAQGSGLAHAAIDPTLWGTGLDTRTATSPPRAAANGFFAISHACSPPTSLGCRKALSQPRSRPKPMPRRACTKTFPPTYQPSRSEKVWAFCTSPRSQTRVDQRPAASRQTRNASVSDAQSQTHPPHRHPVV